MENARTLAAKALMKMERKGSYSNLLWDSLLSQSGLTGRERAFASALFYGVLERLTTLDYLLFSYAKTPRERMGLEVRIALYCGIYQLIYMDGVPESAAVNESVELVKKLGKGRAAGFVNGILRNIQRQGGNFPLPEEEDRRLSVEYACPEWLVKFWKESYGKDQCREILASTLGRPPLYARVNTLRTTPSHLLIRLEEEGVKGTISPHLPTAILLQGTGEVRDLPAFQEGLFHIQDLSSQLCAAALDSQPGQRVYDLCAAPGGKAFTAAQIMEDQGALLAFDIHPHKVRLMKEGARRLGLGCIQAAEGDASIYNQKLPPADRVLCDLPCSGLGIVGRKPEIKYKNPQELEGLPAIQYKILKNAANYVKVGGTLLYSTCALSPRENEENTIRFLNEHPGFAPKGLPEIFDSLFPQREEAHQATIFPQMLGSDGFFLATFERMW